MEILIYILPFAVFSPILIIGIIKFDFCIIDEGQNIKNRTSKISEAVKSIKANCKIALTGTPIENNLYLCRNQIIIIL